MSAIDNFAYEDRLSHIVTKTEAESFDQVAKEASIDPSAKEKGALGWLLPNQIIRSEGNRQFTSPQYKDLIPQLPAGLLQQQRVEAIKRLGESVKVRSSM